MNKTAKRVILSIVWSLVAVIALVVLVFGGYIFYLTTQYFRYADNIAMTIENNKTAVVQVGENYTISTYNIGFGAYNHDFSFFMDSGEFKDGRKVSGTGSRAQSKDVVLTNTNGAINVIKTQNVDFAFFQEVDVKADRSFFVNQYETIQQKFNDYSSVYTENFHSGFLFYPFTNPHGSVKAGLATLSKYKIDSVIRKSFPIDESFPARFFDLDRCFSVNYLPVEGIDKNLVLINMHMSAYDEGGVYRAKQLKLLNEFASAEYAKGNYVVVGGDWNHDIAESINYFESDMKVPSWVAQINASEILEHFSFASSKNCSTCRSTDIPYTLNSQNKLSNYTVVIDGFMVSDNVEIVSIQNLDTDYQFSDHNPAVLQFRLS